MSNEREQSGGVTRVVLSATRVLVPVAIAIAGVVGIVIGHGKTAAAGAGVGLVIVAIIDQIRDVFGDVRWQPLEFLDLGDRVLVRVRIAGTAGLTALPVEQDLGHLYTLRDGLVTRLDIFRTWDEARAAAGLED